MQVTQSALDLAKEAYKKFNSGDIPALLDMFHDDILYHLEGKPDIPYGGTYRGKKEVQQFFQKLNETVQFTKFEPEEYIVEGDKVVTIIDYKAKVKKNGRSFGGKTAHLSVVKDGKVISFRDFIDTRPLYKALKE